MHHLFPQPCCTSTFVHAATLHAPLHAALLRRMTLTQSLLPPL